MEAKPNTRARVWAILGTVVAIVAVILVVVYVLRPTPGTRTTTPTLQTTTFEPSYAVQQSVAAPDGSLWFTEQQYVSGQNSSDSPTKIGHLTAAGTLEEFPLNPGNTFAFGIPFSPVIGSDGNLWFPEEVSGLIHTALPHDAIGRIDAQGTITDYVLPFPSSPFVQGSFATGLTLGPDGNLWFGVNVVTHVGTTPATTTTALELAHITSAGAMTAVPLTPPPAGLSYQLGRGLTLGPDGNVWTSSQPDLGNGTPTGTNDVMRITPAGVVTLYPLPTPGVFPSDFIVGADGNLWFTETDLATSQPGKIARITPSGQMTEFPVTAPQATLLPVLVRNGDNLWFITVTFTGTAPCPTASSTTSYGGTCQLVQTHIGRISPDGTVSLFAVPTPSIVLGLFAGPDGNLYYVGQRPPSQKGAPGNNRLGRVSPSGQIVEYQLRTDQDSAFAILAGSGDTLWLTEAPGQNQTISAVVRITLPRG